MADGVGVIRPHRAPMSSADHGIRRLAGDGQFVVERTSDSRVLTTDPPA